MITFDLFLNKYEKLSNLSRKETVSSCSSLNIASLLLMLERVIKFRQIDTNYTLSIESHIYSIVAVFSANSESSLKNTSLFSENSDSLLESLSSEYFYFLAFFFGLTSFFFFKAKPNLTLKIL